MSERGDLYRKALEHKSESPRSDKFAKNSLAAVAHGDPELEAIYRDWRNEHGGA